MCLIGWSLGRHPRWRAIVAGNRDELRSRRTLPAHWWQDRPDCYGGRDAEAGGSWMVLRRDGRLAALTNYRERWVDGAPPPPPAGAPSRGGLVAASLASTADAAATMQALAQQRMRYAGFNLVIAELGRAEPALHWLSNRASAGALDDAGPHTDRRRAAAGPASVPADGPPPPGAPYLGGVSNHLLDTDWPKQRRLSAALRACESLDDPAAIENALLAALSDTAAPADAELPDTGVGLERERMLAPPFIAADHYGTRTTTVILVDRAGTVRHLERTWRRQDGGFAREDRRQRFELGS